MTSLPGMTTEMDVQQFKDLFDRQEFKPDALKIYPTLVLPDTRLFDMWKSGQYQPPSTEKTIEILSKSISFVPPYCRIVRMQRTMSAYEIQAGVDKSNLRELVERKAEADGIQIKEIRYREVGRAKISDSDSIELKRMDYDGSNGKEIFLSYEDSKGDVIYGFVRLRIPNESRRKEVGKDSALIRELHVYGPSLPIGKKDEDSTQHKGMGKRLLKEAERIASEEFGKDKLVVISGIGAREYYYKRGYVIDGPYVSKKL
jgi:elongator complex protein 3